MVRDGRNGAGYSRPLANVRLSLRRMRACAMDAVRPVHALLPKRFVQSPAQPAPVRHAPVPDRLGSYLKHSMVKDAESFQEPSALLRGVFAAAALAVVVIAAGIVFSAGIS